MRVAKVAMTADNNCHSLDYLSIDSLGPTCKFLDNRTHPWIAMKFAHKFGVEPSL